MGNKIKPARAVKNRIETVKETLEPYEIVISTDTEQIAYKKSNNEVAYMANEKKLNDEVNNLLSYINQIDEMKQEKLVSGVNIKTLGMQSLLGSGNIPIPSTEEFASKVELAPYISAKNLGAPDLKGKEYLGDGWYRYRTQDGITMDYNIYNGYVALNGTRTSGNDNLFLGLFRNFFTNGTRVSFKYYYVSGTFDSSTEYNHLFANSSGTPGGEPLKIGLGYNQTIFFQNYEYNYGSAIPRIFLGGGTITFNNFTFRVQLEKGSTATPFAVPAGVIPYIPEVKKANEWFLVATNSVAGGDIISIPNNLNELLIIANEHSTVHLPNISQASGLSVRTLGSGLVNTGATWRTTTTTIVKGWPDGTTAQSTEYKIYGR